MDRSYVSYIRHVVTLYYTTIKQTHRDERLRFTKLYANVFGITNYRSIMQLMRRCLLSFLHFYCACTTAMSSRFNQYDETL